MRTYTEKQLAAMLAEGGHATHYRVRVEADGEWYNLTNLEGRPFCRGVSWDTTIDAFVTDATVELAPVVDGMSLSPIDLDSVVNGIPTDGRPLLDEGRLFIIEVAVMSPGEAPGDDDWVEAFRGVSARTNVAGRGQMVGRDYGDALSDILIEVERDYGSEAGVPLVTVMNQILSDNGVPFSLVAAEDPDFLCGPFRQKKMLVREALQALADQIGWDVRFMWWDGVGFQLTLWTPDRDKTEPDWSYSASQYALLSRCETSVENVRNRWVGTYLDKTDLDSTGKPKQKQVVVQDGDSIARYSPIPGANIPRPTMIAEAGTTNIDTAAEMTRMLTAALKDYKDVFLEVEVDVPFNPFIEVGDLIRLEENRTYFSGDQDLGVQSMVHRLGNTAVTTLTLRGKPSTSRKRWLRLQSSKDQAPTYSTPNPPASVSSTPTVNGFTVQVIADVYGQPVDTWELHVSETSGFTPDNSVGSTTLLKTFRGTGTEVTGLKAGTTYYAKVVGRDTKGNRSTPSSEFSLTARYVEPRLLQPRIAYGALPPNADFEALNDAAEPPDNWTVSSGTWGVDVASSDDAYAGSRAMLMPSGNSATLSAQLFTVRAGEEWIVSAWFKQSTAGIRTGTLSITWLSTPVSAISAVTTAIGGPSTASGIWSRAAMKATVPAGARYAHVVIARDYSSSGTLAIDSVDALRLSAFEPWLDVVFENGWLPANQSIYGFPQYRKNDSGEVEMRSVVGAPAAPAADSTITTLPSGYRPPARRQFVAGGSMIEVRPDGTIRAIAATAGMGLTLDGIRFQAEL
jgi:hypothetical protein